MENNFFDGANNFSNMSAANTTLGQNMGVTSDYKPVTDDELLKAFIGENYEKIMNGKFNIPVFFLKTFYMFYRKMFLYGILTFILGTIIATVTGFLGRIAVSILLGFFVNKLYIYYAKNKIAKIKSKNPNKSGNELKELCKAKGGANAGCVFMGFLAEFGIIIVAIVLALVLGLGSAITGIFKFFKDVEMNGPEVNVDMNTTIPDDTTNNNKNDGVTVSGNKKLIEDVKFGSSFCMNSNCTLYGAGGEYVCNKETGEILKMLADYNDTVKLDIYYTEKDEARTIVDYKVYNRDTKKELDNFKTESELRTLLGLASTGKHTLELIYVEAAGIGSSVVDGKVQRYSNYNFKDEKGKVYEMKYVEENGKIELQENKKYTVTYEVVESFFGYENYITNIK